MATLKPKSKSTPVTIPGGLKNSALKRSILKNSVDSDYSGTPEVCGSNHSIRSAGVRFNEDNVESPDYYLYDASKIGGQAIISPMVAFSKITAKKHTNAFGFQREADTDSLNGQEGSDDEEESEDDRLSERSNSPASVHFSTSMSAEAQYAVLKAYEDELLERLQETFPAVSKRLANVRSKSPDPHREDEQLDDEKDFLDMDQVSVVSTTNPQKVASRLKMAMDIMDSVREASGEEIAMGSSHSRRIAKDPVRSFEKWCGSLRETLSELNV